MTISLPLTSAVSVFAEYLLNGCFHTFRNIEKILNIINSVAILKEQIDVLFSNTNIACELLQFLDSGTLKPFGVILRLCVSPPV